MYPQLPVQTQTKKGIRNGQGVWMAMILILQTFLTFTRIIYLVDVTNGFLMGVVAILGWYALRRSLDITLVSIWGLACAALFLSDVVEALQDIGSYAVNLKYSTIAIILANPMTDFLAANYAWELFKEHERSGGMLQPLFSTGAKETKAADQNYYQTDVEKAVPAGRSTKYGQPGYSTEYGQPGYYDTYSAGYDQEQELRAPEDGFTKAPGSRKTNTACC
eukprot:CAMPEP_0197643012 /NCGR_PEP_ID=MMETSP1338-20131121/16493_1 /TAXON_ID=43686 ORGANISM="Pelagodinium beii, Strain RCC1491" /NCGR_SAMPLE_ID=MMETSP1338 /ASSEMBLY_ACC=CAM_ASM_000754 /LENGTH=219 /DNA_ID=CAMNT_0043216221 /DNA_START=116 /DNA_END=775 /DNA_ORIENTATION=+